MEKGADKLFYERFALNDIVAESLSLHSMPIKSKKIVVSVESSAAEIAVSADKNKILQVINNLLTNAVKFSKENGKIIISLTKLADDSAEFKIQDFGIGIPPEKIEKIFEQFYQIDASPTRAYSGLGLGLAICKNIIELHSGIIKAESVLNEGSIFRFILPCVKASAGSSAGSDSGVKTAADQTAETATLFKSGLKNRTALIIDDNAEILEFMSILLSSENFNALQCNNPKNALSILRHQAVDIILLDVSMKEMDGCEVCRIIKNDSHAKKIPVLMVTARAEKSVRQICIEAGADDIILKPFSNKELITKIYDLLLGKS